MILGCPSLRSKTSKEVRLEVSFPKIKKEKHETLGACLSVCMCVCVIVFPNSPCWGSNFGSLRRLPSLEQSHLVNFNLGEAHSGVAWNQKLKNKSPR